MMRVAVDAWGNPIYSSPITTYTYSSTPVSSTPISSAPVVISDDPTRVYLARPEFTTQSLPESTTIVFPESTMKPETVLQDIEPKTQDAVKSTDASTEDSGQQPADTKPSLTDEERSKLSELPEFGQPAKPEETPNQSDKPSDPADTSN